MRTTSEMAPPPAAATSAGLYTWKVPYAATEAGVARGGVRGVRNASTSPALGRCCSSTRAAAMPAASIGHNCPWLAHPRWSTTERTPLRHRAGSAKSTSAAAAAVAAAAAAVASRAREEPLARELRLRVQADRAHGRAEAHVRHLAL